MAPGFSLVEVLVAIVVLAIGLLGLARLQIVSLKGNQSAYVLSQATLEAYNIIDCMRANRTAVESGSYNTALGATSTGGSSVVQNDLANWKNTLADVLPDGDGAGGVRR